MDTAKRQQLVDAIVRAFFSPDNLTAWVTLRIPNTNPYTILNAPGFPGRALDLLVWAESEGRENEILQLLADHSPLGAQGRDLVLEVNLVTAGAIKPSGSDRAPIPPHDDWFVTSLPFVNRDPLRGQLRTLNTATPGGDSILVISGPKSSGKSYGMRLAQSCAPSDRAHVDLKEWGDQKATVWQVAAAIYPRGASEIPAKDYDESKEDSYVTSLLIWLIGKLKGDEPRWVLIDHSDRGSLTEASSTLLKTLAAKVERGDLPNVRLVFADAKPGVLPAKLKPNILGRWDTADLPDRVAVATWCVTLAAHLQRVTTEKEVEGFVDDVFKGLPAKPTREELVGVLEARLSDVYQKLKTKSN